MEGTPPATCIAVPDLPPRAESRMIGGRCRDAGEGQPRVNRLRKIQTSPRPEAAARTGAGSGTRIGSCTAISPVCRSADSMLATANGDPSSDQIDTFPPRSSTDGGYSTSVGAAELRLTKNETLQRPVATIRRTRIDTSSQVARLMKSIFGRLGSFICLLSNCVVRLKLNL